MKDNENNNSSYIDDMLHKLDLAIEKLENTKIDNDININIKIDNDNILFKRKNDKCSVIYNNKENIISIDEFNDFLDEFYSITSPWKNNLTDDDKPYWIITVKTNKNKKEKSGDKNFPNNWNKFIDLISKYKTNKSISFEKLVKEKINNLDTQKIIIDYFKNEINDSEDILISLFESVSKYDDIFSEFISSITNDTYDFNDPVTIEGYNAKKLVSLNHNFKTSGVYIFLNLLRENPSLAKETIETNFNNEEVNNNEYYLKVIRRYSQTTNENKESKRPIISYHDPKIKLITINKINIVVNEINDDNIKFTLLYNEEITPNNKEEVDLKLNETYNIEYKSHNISENITIELVDKNDLNNI